MNDEQGKIRHSYLSLFRARRFLTIELPLHVLGDLLHCRVGSKRVAYWHYSYCPPPNRACNFHRTRLSSVSFHLSFFLDDVKYRFDLLHYACLSVYRV